MSQPLSAVETLEAHLAWAQGSWLGFAFADDAGAVRQLAEAVRSHAPGANLLAPRTPQELREGVARLIDQPPAKLTWLVACFDLAAEPWEEAADWFLMRSNERRQPLLDHLGGGLLIALPRAYRARVARAAPDLWSVRALVLDLPPSPAPLLPQPPVQRRIDALLRRLGFQARMRSDPWHAEIRARQETDRRQAARAIAAALPQLEVRMGPPLRVGMPPGEAVASLQIDLDAPLPPEVHELAPDPTLEPSDPLGSVDESLRTAAATWSQGWASETLELAERAVEGLGEGRPDDDRRMASALELGARARRELGDPPGALEALHRAVHLRRRLLGLHGADRPQRQRELARALSLRGQVLLAGPRPTEAESDLQEALGLRTALAQWSDDPETLGELALSHSLLADLHVAIAAVPEDLRTAEAASREALALRRRIVDAVDATRHLRQLGLAWGRLGRILDRQVFLRESERAWSKAVQYAARVAAASALPVHTLEESVARTQLAAVRWRRGDRSGAREEVARGIAQRRRLLADDPANARWAERLAVALGQGAQQALDEGDLPQANTWAEEAVQVGEQLVPTTGPQLRGLALAHLRLGDVRSASSDHEGAAASWDEARRLVPALELHSAVRAEQLRQDLALRGR